MRRPQLLKTSTLLLAPLALLLACAGFTIGLTFAPCYSSLCVETVFPYRARIHVAVFYALVGVVGICLAARSVSKVVRKTSETYVLATPLPLLGFRVSVGGLLLLIWIAGLTLGSTGYWYPAQHAYWLSRGRLAGWTEYMFRVTWTGVTGHWCDILLGLVFLPVGRHGILSTVLHVNGSTLLLAHKLLAYALCVGGLIHGFLYYSFLAAYITGANASELVHKEFNPDNPYKTWDEVAEIGPYGWFVLPTGAIGGIILIPVMVITALPVLRRMSYNAFYFIHIIFACLVLLVLCLHSSTDFYCVLPGLLLWVYDWTYRLRHSLVSKAIVHLENAGNGWYRMHLPKQSHQECEGDISDTEKGASILETTYPIRNPLQTYYVRIGNISKLEIHPFTAAMPETSSNGPALLFREGPARQNIQKRDKEWTWQLAALAKQSLSDRPLELSARIEGPYPASIPILDDMDCILAIVGGTGITGAFSLAHWWIAQSSSTQQQRPKHLQILWTIRSAEMAKVAEVKAIQTLFAELHGDRTAELRIHISADAGRMDPEAGLRAFLEQQAIDARRTWVYISGPDSLSKAAERACVTLNKEMRQRPFELEWYSASFTV